MKRREFIKNTGMISSGILLSNYLTACAAASSSNDISKNFGLQLYTLRDVMPNDPKDTLKQVASFGYKQIESYEHSSMGMFWGMKNTEFKKLMDDLGMKIVSSHCNINQDFERKAAEAAEIGMRYLLCAYLGPQKTIDDFKKFAETFNQRGEICKKNGIKFGYHNHDYGFVQLEGQYPQDVLMQNTDKALVDFEMDIYWVVTAGQDPIAWIDKYPGRFKLCHIKDRKKNVPLSDRDASVILGTGSIDFKKILKEADAKGMEYYIVEQEAYENTTPLDAAKADADYLKNFRLS
ncbi:MAG: sugar phosphate isomerase/epimerase [Flavisolibacter sp.]|nr:sugar phosphate isomerase/epimerase [Flavisolibacter sp.]